MFGDEQFQAKRFHLGEKRRELFLIDRRSKSTEVSLKPERVDGNAARQRTREEVEGRGAETVVRRSACFAAPVIVHEQRAGIGAPRRVKRSIDVTGTEGVEPEAAAQGIGTA